MWLPLLVGALCGAVFGFAASGGNNRPKAIVSSFFYAAALAVVTLIFGVPGATALAFFAGIFLVALGALMLPRDSAIARFFRRAFE